MAQIRLGPCAGSLAMSLFSWLDPLFEKFLGSGMGL